MAAETDDLYTIEEEGNYFKFYASIPHLIDEMNLSPYAYRLYCHFKHVVGERPGGKCWQSTAQLAERCNMSVGAVVKAKTELVQRGLIRINLVKLQKGGRAAHNIVILNIWKKNFLAHTASQPASSQDELDPKPSSQGELASSPHELNKNTNNNNTNPRAASAGDQPKKEARKLKSQPADLGFLEGVFAEARGVPVPDWTRGAAGLMNTWRFPMDDLLSACDGRLEVAEKVVRNAVNQMRKDRLTFTKPIQILEVANSIIADWRAKKAQAGQPVGEGKPAGRVVNFTKLRQEQEAGRAN